MFQWILGYVLSRCKNDRQHAKGLFQTAKGVMSIKRRFVIEKHASFDVKMCFRDAKKYRRHANTACSDTMVPLFTEYVVCYFDKVCVFLFSRHVDVLYPWTHRPRMGAPSFMSTATSIKPLDPRKDQLVENMKMRPNHSPKPHQVWFSIKDGLWTISRAINDFQPDVWSTNRWWRAEVNDVDVGNPKTKCAPFVCRTSKWWTSRVYCWVYRITCQEGVKQSGKAQTPASSLKGLWISELHCQLSNYSLVAGCWWQRM